MLYLISERGFNNIKCEIIVIDSNYMITTRVLVFNRCLFFLQCQRLVFVNTQIRRDKPYYLISSFG
jgi:hypothetical protein